MDRPIVTKEMITEAAKITAEQVSGITEKEELAVSIAENYRPYIDGFELGKALDSEGWRIDVMAVDDLDCMDNNVRELLRAACKQWAEENDIQPPLPVGTMIDEGEITGIYEHDAACYLVKLHGEDDSSTRRRIIKFEDAKKVA